MANTVKVEWTIHPVSLPEPWFECAGCSALKPFHATGKARLNANGRRLDAWLIYQCNTCGTTRNLPIFERKQVETVGASVLAALQENDVIWCKSQASNMALLKRFSARIDLSKDYTLVQSQASSLRPSTEQIEIDVTCTGPVQLRLDRLLAEQLGVSRAVVTRWHRSGALACSQGSLNKSLKSSARIWLSTECLSRTSLRLVSVLELAD